MQNSSPILARQWWRHFRLSLSLFLYYRKRGSASYIVREVLSVREREREREIQREREKDGSDVTIVALKLAMNLHIACQKFAQLAISLHFPCQKFALFVSPFTEVTIVALKFAISSHFHCQSFFALFVPPLLNGTSRATSDRKPQANFVLPIEKLNQINTKNYWK